MEDGSRWDIPAGVIAIDHARYYSKVFEEFSGNVVEAYTEDTIPSFEVDHRYLINWARKEMKWSEVEEYAVRVKPDLPVDYQKGWHSEHGYKEVLCDW